MYKDQTFLDLVENKKMVCSEKRELADRVRYLPIPVDGSWSEDFEDIIENQLLPKIYYFVVLDCEHSTHARVRTMPKIEVEFEAMSKELIEGDLSQFSYED